MYKRNIKVRCCNHCCCRGKAVSIAFSGCMFVALFTQDAMRIYCNIVTCGLSGSTIPLYNISQRAHFRKKVTEHKTCALIFSTTFV
jgi:hypothetical protein